MPYLKKDTGLRQVLDKLIAHFAMYLILPGALNYVLFKLAKYACHNYEQYRNFLGELEAAKLEIYRRQVAPYEDIKIEENGDVE